MNTNTFTAEALRAQRFAESNQDAPQSSASSASLW